MGAEWAWRPVATLPPREAIYAVLCRARRHGSGVADHTVHTLAWWDGHEWATGVTYPHAVTHWMALPEVPA